MECALVGEVVAMVGNRRVNGLKKMAAYRLYKHRQWYNLTDMAFKFKYTSLCFLSCLVFGAELAVASEASPYADESGFIRVSQKDPRYLEYDDGTPYIAIGANYCFDRTTGDSVKIRQNYARDFAAMKAAGANFVRIMMQADFTELEKPALNYRPEIFRNIDFLVDIARENGIKLKLSMDSFRTIKHSKYAKSGIKDMDEYLTSPRWRAEFLKKIDMLASRYAKCNAIFAIELWNEMNCVSAKTENVVEWTDYMCREVKKRFPNTLVVQSLGSFDRGALVPVYKSFMELKSNEVAQVHRYLDLGAALPVCKGPFTEMSSDAISEIRKMVGDTKPIILGETGAVKPHHTGPWEYYEADKDGIILHDLTFAPFFAGSAGTGHVWHWDQLLINPNRWWQYARFNEAIKKVNVLEEGFKPVKSSSDDVNFYALVGKKNTMIFCRDMRNTWQSEFVEGMPPEVRSGVEIDLSQFMGDEKIKEIKRVRIYNPWTDKWSKSRVSNGKIRLPKFSRSVVVRIYE